MIASFFGIRGFKLYMTSRNSVAPYRCILFIQKGQCSLQWAFKLNSILAGSRNLALKGHVLNVKRK